MLEFLIIHDEKTAQIVHTLFEWAALSVGFALYKIGKIRRGDPSSLLAGSGLWVVVGCLLGAGIGNKMVSFAQYPTLWAELFSTSWDAVLFAFLSGQSIVGGLLGGWIGVEIGKKVNGLTRRTGDDFVVPILAGIAIGRIGCFVAGLYDGTYGVHSTLPWAVDFGDGPRHPAQLYESVAAFAALLLYPCWKKKVYTRGGAGISHFDGDLSAVAAFD